MIPLGRGKTCHTAQAFIKAQLDAGKKGNRLLAEKSPYLLQHAFNPVDWYPWGEEAFSRARAEDKPLFISIGYSTCHWCHVMAHDTFEDRATADYLNRHFIAIKVDREERPDIDRIYMTAVLALNNSSGWPLNVFSDHEGRPFFGGTYYPSTPRDGIPSFLHVLAVIHRAWSVERWKIVETAQDLHKYLEMERKWGGPDALDQALLDKGVVRCREDYDPEHGGFSRAPKFPRPVLLNFLLRSHFRTGSDEPRDMVLTTLRHMAAGGIRDHLGGGFHRYSVDGQWRVPHFEKMLYDQALLAIAYLEAYQVSGDALFAEEARSTLDYVLKDLTDPSGGFYSAEDADSPCPDAPDRQAEGAFYLWQREEIEALLGEEAALFNFHYGVRSDGNALADPHGEFAGRNILYQAATVEETATRFGCDIGEVQNRLDACRQRLLMGRNQRPRPHLDDKVITAWNGLMVSALARGFEVLGEPRYLSAAKGAAAFLVNRVYDRCTYRLQRRFRDGEAGLPGQLDDYAFLAQALLDLYEVSFEEMGLFRALELAEAMTELFYDGEKGGFFDSPVGEGILPVRMKGDFEGAEPAANSVAVTVLLRLARLTNDSRWQKMAEKSLSFFAEELNREPLAMPQMLVALDLLLARPQRLVVVGRRGAHDTQAFLAKVHGRFLPHRTMVLVDRAEVSARLAMTLPYLDSFASPESDECPAMVYLCDDFSCRLPINDPVGLADLLPG